MNIFRIAIILSFLFVSETTLAQNCKEIKDEFTGKTTKTASVYLQGSAMTPGYFINLSFSKDDSTRKISMIYTNTTVADLQPENLSFLLKLSNGEILRFGANADTRVTQFNGTSQILSLYNDLTSDVIEKLQKNEIQTFRLGFKNDDGLTIQVQTNKAERIKKALGCVL